MDLGSYLDDESSQKSGSDAETEFDEEIEFDENDLYNEFGIVSPEYDRSFSPPVIQTTGDTDVSCDVYFLGQDAPVNYFVCEVSAL